MKFEKPYFKDSEISNYRNYELDKKYSALVKELIDIFNLKKNHYICDFGCATGILLNEFYKQGFSNIAGTDVSYWAITQGKNNTNIGEYLHYYNLNLLNSYFDYVFFFDVLEHINDQELHNILSLLNTPNVIVKIPVSRQEGEPYLLEISRNDDTHIQCHTREWWTELFKKFGYTFVKTVNGKIIYDSEGLFAAHFQKEVEIRDLNKKSLLFGRKFFSAALVYIENQNYGLKDFLEKIGNYVDSVWAIYNNVDIIENIEQLTTANLKTVYLDTYTYRGKAFKEVIINLVNEEEVDIIAFIEYSKDEAIDLLPRLMHPINLGYADVVIGSRFHGHIPKMSFPRRLVNHLVTGFIRWRFQFACTDSLSRYLVISTKTLKKIRFNESNFGWSLNIIKETAKNKIGYSEISIRNHNSNLTLIQKVFAVKDIFKVLATTSKSKPII